MLKMSLNIEHFSKVKLMRRITNDADEDGYSISTPMVKLLSILLIVPLLFVCALFPCRYIYLSHASQLFVFSCVNNLISLDLCF